MCTQRRKPTETVLLPEDVVAALRDVLTYLWYDEGRHYEEIRPERRGSHICASRRQIKQCFDED